MRPYSGVEIGDKPSPSEVSLHDVLNRPQEREVYLEEAPGRHPQPDTRVVDPYLALSP